MSERESSPTPSPLLLQSTSTGLHTLKTRGMLFTILGACGIGSFAFWNQQRDQPYPSARGSLFTLALHHSMPATSAHSACPKESSRNVALTSNTSLTLETAGRTFELMLWTLNDKQYSPETCVEKVKTATGEVEVPLKDKITGLSLQEDGSIALKFTHGILVIPTVDANRLFEEIVETTPSPTGEISIDDMRYSITLDFWANLAYAKEKCFPSEDREEGFTIPDLEGKIAMHLIERGILPEFAPDQPDEGVLLTKE